MPSRTVRTPEKDAEFLKKLMEGASISGAAITVGYARSSVYEWRASDYDFAAAWDEAVDCGTDLLEDEALRRAKDGVDEPKFYEGHECGYVRKYSDTLTIFLLKARRPDKFSDRVQVAGNGGGPIQVEYSETELARRIAFALTKAAKSEPA